MNCIFFWEKNDHKINISGPKLVKGDLLEMKKSQRCGSHVFTTLIIPFNEEG